MDEFFLREARARTREEFYHLLADGGSASHYPAPLVSQEMIRQYAPLRVIPHVRNGAMSMKTTVAIVGARYHPGAPERLRRLDSIVKASWPSCRPPTGKRSFPLVLVREPHNAHDPNAVAVTSLGEMLGYVPRQDARVVARVMDAGVQVRATYRGDSTVELWWPASTREGVDEAYRRAMSEGEGL